jgi:hypothetical protein
VSARLTPEQLQDVSDIIRSASLDRGAVLTSTPEQIVHMTARAIEDNLIAYANGEDSRYRWLPTVYGTVADIRRGIEMSKLTDKTKARVLGLIDQYASGWPA